MSARHRGRRLQAGKLELLYSRHSQHLLVDLLQGIDTLLEVDVIGWELGLYQIGDRQHVNQGPYCRTAVNPTNLVICLTEHLLGRLESAGGKRGKLRPEGANGAPKPAVKGGRRQLSELPSQSSARFEGAGLPEGLPQVEVLEVVHDGCRL